MAASFARSSFALYDMLSLRSRRMPSVIGCSSSFAFVSPRGSMTLEELNRTMEFIIASQARLAAAQEQDRLDRIEFQQWSKGIAVKLEAREENMRASILNLMVVVFLLSFYSV